MIIMSGTRGAEMTGAGVATDTPTATDYIGRLDTAGSQRMLSIVTAAMAIWDGATAMGANMMQTSEATAPVKRAKRPRGRSVPPCHIAPAPLVVIKCVEQSPCLFLRATRFFSMHISSFPYDEQD
jgi:hypothetical protein